MTNKEKFAQMSSRELAEFIYRIDEYSDMCMYCVARHTPFCNKIDCTDGIEQWLNKEIDND